MNSIEKLRETSLPGGREISHLPARGSDYPSCLKHMVSNLLSTYAYTHKQREKERGVRKREGEREREKTRERWELITH